MSFTINHVSLVGGNLVRDAEMKYTGGGTPVLNFDIAMNRSWRNKESGEIQEEVSYFKVNYWGKPAEGIQKYLTKGKKVAIEGRMQQRRWEGPDGKTNSIVEVVASSVILIGGIDTDSNEASQANSYNQNNQVHTPEVVQNAPLPIASENAEPSIPQQVKQAFGGQELTENDVPF